MGFGEAIAQVFRKYVVFNGRARRSEYWYFFLFYILASIAISVIEVSAGLAFSAEGYGPLSTLFALGTLLPLLAVSVRRLHDIDRTGWWVSISFIPLIGIIILLIFYVRSGTEGPNRFGEDPKGLGSVVEEF